MSKCYVETYPIPSADLGPENPMPDIKNISYIHAGIDIAPKVPEEDRTHIGDGMIPTLLPYRIQDGYTRELKERNFNAVILENEFLKAVFLPELGGRLWSLIDKENGRELLYRNEVFQPCNLALRNAWFSGGVEFNVSIKGHSPLTCDSVFAKKIKMSDGSEEVRLYEYERIRGVAYFLDAWIPDGSKSLYIRPNIENRTGHSIWMYWWSNIAVPELSGTRVIVPAEEALINYFDNDHYVIDCENIPYLWNTDVTFPENLNQSLDFFYRIPENRDKWIAAVGPDGYGLLQSSNRKLVGRKMFLWGYGNGGRNWNNYLSHGSDKGYIEIQAGLARTQLEHIPMENGAVWSWVETYGVLKAQPNSLHGEWKTAQNTVESYLSEQFGGDMNGYLTELEGLSATEQELLHLGSGWGALENERRKADGEEPLSNEIDFPQESIGQLQAEWLGLLHNGYLKEQPVENAPASFAVDKSWRDRLKASVESGKSRHWYGLMHLGVMEYACGNLSEAKAAFEQSVEMKPNAWALRNLAMLYNKEYNDKNTAADTIIKAVGLLQNCLSLWRDAANLLLDAGRSQQWLELYETLTDTFKNDGRLKYACVLAFMQQERYREAADILNADFVLPDIKEGDTSVSDTWRILYKNIVKFETGEQDDEKAAELAEKRYPLGNLDFRIH